MFSKFLGLEEEKKERIINAALQEFARKGFDDASTNDIVKVAGISKGLLFHYFKSKKDLFRFLYDHVMEIFEREYFDLFDALDGDIFERLKQVTLMKIRLVDRYPHLFNFAMAIRTSLPDGMRDDLDRRVGELTARAYGRLFEGIDATAFRDGIDITKALNLVRWTLEGYANRLAAQVKVVPLGQWENERIVSEIEEYYELIRKGIYR